VTGRTGRLAGRNAGARAESPKFRFSIVTCGFGEELIAVGEARASLPKTRLEPLEGGEEWLRGRLGDGLVGPAGGKVGWRLILSKFRDRRA
jgi:hypothetical protein